METHARDKKTVIDAVLNGFSPVSSPMIYWKSRRRLSPSGRKLEVSENTANKPAEGSSAVAVLSERRKALFEPLQPINNTVNGPRPSAESLLPHPPSPDFESANYPKGWLIGKKRKLVNVDVVQSMRRIAIQEMNRKDREIEGLNEQLDEDSRCLERLQLQLAQERSKRAQVERENAMLQDQVNILISMLQQNDQMGEEDQGPEEP